MPISTNSSSPTSPTGRSPWNQPKRSASSSAQEITPSSTGSFTKEGYTLFLCCISRQEGQDLLCEIHQGLYGAHQAPRSLTAKALRQGLYWPTALRDAEDLVQKYQGCQWIGRNAKASQTPLQPLPLVCPFARWGIDIIGLSPVRREIVTDNGSHFDSTKFKDFYKGIDTKLCFT